MSTLKRSITFSGRGLVTGEISRVTLIPGDKGIVFVIKEREFLLSLEQTSVGFHNLTVGGVLYIEHLLSALFGCGIDDVFINVEGDEIPFFDGSALQFVEEIKDNIDRSRKKKNNFFIKEQIEEIDTIDGGYIKAEPSDKLEIKVTIDYSHKGLERQTYTFNEKVNYIEEIAPARTFSFLEDIEKYINIYKGADLNSAIILHKGKPINTELRYTDEFVRHKVLDFLGDIFCLGRLIGKFEVFKPSHHLSRRFLERIAREGAISKETS